MKSEITIVDYEDRYQEPFRDLNLEWLDKFNLREDRDMEVLEDPRSTIIDKGGFIWLAKCNDRIIGSSAIMLEHDGVYELAKMSVAPEWRGNGVSKLLIEVCLEKARALKAKKLELFSNNQLKAALKLYENYGFRYVDVTDSPFQTADIKMELEL